MPTNVPTIIGGVFVEIDVASGKGAIGIDIYAGKGVVSDNSVQVDGTNLDGGEKNYGYYFRGMDNSTIRGNVADLVNDTAGDIGYLLDADADENHGGDNISYNVGTSITDNGTGNDVTVTDV